MAAAPNQKNILLISFDDAVAFWKYKTAFGAALQTPNLDRICAASTAFQAAYCQAPICSPSRASFMSGLSPHQSGITGTCKEIFEKIPAQDMWPAYLKQNGYFCSSGGKVVHGYVPLPKDAHETLYSDAPKKFRVDWRVPPDISVEYGGFRGGKATTDPAHDVRFYDHQAASSAISFLQTYDGDAPFYREVGFYGPHGPWITPARFKEMYDETTIRKPQAWRAGFEDNAFMNELSPPNIKLQRTKNWRKSVRNYFSAFTHADHHLGRVWDALKASSHAQDTVVILVSDHGMHLGERSRFRKHTLFEQVLNVPVILHDPDASVPQVVSDPVGLIDVGQTVADYAGLPPLERSPGKSLRPYVEWAREPDRAIPSFYHGSASVRQGKYRFTRYEDGTETLHDLSRDWWQARALPKDDPAYPTMRKTFAKTCAEYGMAPTA